jgi:hypothetical protein
MSERPTCKTCPYWAGDLEESGECRAHSPRFAPQSSIDEGFADGDNAAWPASADTDWCGEHPRFSEWIAAHRSSLTPDQNANLFWEGCSVRLRNSLKAEGITSPEDLSRVTRAAIAQVRTIGKHNLTQLLELMDKYGYRFLSDPP